MQGQIKGDGTSSQSKSEPLDNMLPWSMPPMSLLNEVFPPACSNFFTDSRVVLECPEEETWIPSDQTVHWGKRPFYVYPQLKLLKKEELPSVPRGSRLVAKLWYCEYSWDQIDKTTEGSSTSPRQGSWRSEPGSTSCFEDEKTIVPFERGTAVFRHLRINKEIKLKKTETFTINALGVEIGYHNPYTKVPYKSLEIYLSRPTKIHIVAHKGSVKLMQKRGLLPNNVATSLQEVVPMPSPDTRPQVLKPLRRPKTEGSKQQQDQGAMTLGTVASEDPPKPGPAQSPDSSQDQSSQMVQKRPAPAREDLETLKRLKINQLGEVINEISTLQSHLDSLKSKIQDFMSTSTTQTPKILQKSVRVACNPEQFRPILFIFYAFRTRNLDLAVSLIRAFNFDINEKDPVTGYTVLHVAAKHAFMEGVQWCLMNGAFVNAETSLKCTPLHLAYLRNDKRIRKLLKQGKADINALNCYGLKPKDYHNTRKPLERPLPETTYSVEVVIDGFDRPFFLEIWFAARIGWLDVVRIYIEQLGCDVDVKNTNGQTPLMCATEHCHLETVTYLLRMGADPNARDIHDSTPLHYAYMTYGFNESANAFMVKIIEMLEKQGADPNLRNIWNRNPQWYKLKSIESPWKWSF